MTVELFDTILAGLLAVALFAVWFSKDDWRE